MTRRRIGFLLAQVFGDGSPVVPQFRAILRRDQPALASVRIRVMSTMVRKFAMKSGFTSQRLMPRLILTRVADFDSFLGGAF